MTKSTRSKRFDCPACRSRKREYITLGPFQFCNMACAMKYRCLLTGWIAREQHSLDALEEAMQPEIPEADINRVAEAISEHQSCSSCASTTAESRHCKVCTEEAKVAIRAYLKRGGE